jgi:SAM-dependent methyltransferase
MDMKNLKRFAADLYDLEPGDIFKDDIAFYKEKAKESGGPILELGCGTGRVTIPLLEEGNEVWGLDLSEDMLSQLRKKVGDLPVAVARRLHMVHDDMACFDLGRVFELIIAPFRAFQAITARTDQARCLAQVKRHLSDRGRFILHVFRPTTVLDETWVKPESLNWEIIDPRSNKRVQRYERRKRIDLERQIIYVDLIYRIENSREIVEPLALSYFYENQLRNVLESSGFQIVAESGYFDGRSIANGPELIFICQ